LKNGYILFYLRYTKDLASLLNKHYPKSESTMEDDVHQHFEQITGNVQRYSSAERKDFKSVIDANPPPALRILLEENVDGLRDLYRILRNVVRTARFWKLFLSQ